MFKLLAFILLLTPTLVSAGYDVSIRSFSKQIAVDNTAERILACPRKSHGVLIRAKASNAASLYVGSDNVNPAQGFELAPGEGIGFDDLYPTKNIELYELCEFYVYGTSTDFLDIVYLHDKQLN
jgi:hypothetical protein